MYPRIVFIYVYRAYGSICIELYIYIMCTLTYSLPFIYVYSLSRLMEFICLHCMYAGI